MGKLNADHYDLNGVRMIDEGVEGANNKALEDDPNAPQANPIRVFWDVPTGKSSIGGKPETELRPLNRAQRRAMLKNKRRHIHVRTR